MANINKNKQEEPEDIKVSSIQKTKEKINKLSWWAKLFLVCFFGFIFSVLSILIVINIPSVKDSIAQKAIEILNKEFKTQIKTENIEINFLGDVVITGVSAKDHHNFDFFKAKRLIGHSDWFELIFNSRDLKFQKLALEELELEVITYKGENQDNFTLFIEKFDSPKDPKKPPFKFTSRIQIENSKLSIVNENQGEDGRWLKAENLDAYVSNLKVIGADVKLKFNRLSFITERWGKKHFLETLSGDLEITKEKFAFKDLIFNTDHSILQGDLIFNLDKNTGWKDFNDKVVWDMNLEGGSVLSGYDISYFVKNWDNYQNYQLLGKMKGVLNDFTLNDFTLKMRDNSLSSHKIRFSNLLNGDFYIKTDRLFTNITYSDIREGLPKFISHNMGNFADEFGRIRYDGAIGIDKKKVSVGGNLITDVGQAYIQDFSLHEYSSAFPRYRGSLTLKDFNVPVITKQNKVGFISGNFNIEGRGFDINTLSLKTKSNITSIELLGKKVHNVYLDGVLLAKNFNGLVQVEDKSFNGKIKGEIDFSKPKILANIKGDISRLDMAYWGMAEGKSIFRGNVDGKFSMTDIRDLVMDADLQNVVLEGEKNISIPKGAMKLAFQEGKRVVNVDIPNAIQGEIIGNFGLENIGGIFEEATSRILVGNKVKKYYKGQSFSMDIDVYQDLIDYFNPDIKIPDGMKITGSFNGDSNDLLFNANSPSFKYIMINKEEITEADRILALHNPHYIIRESVKKDSIVAENLTLGINTADLQKYWNVDVDRVVYRESLLKDIRINAENRNNAELHIETNLQIGTLEKEKSDQMVAYTANIDQSVNDNGDYVFKFDPTNLKISKFIWMVDTSPELNHSITYRRKTKDIDIHNLKLYSDSSEILVNGIFKNGKDFDISGNVKNLDISKVWYVLFQDNKVDLQGIANGELKVKMNSTHLEPNIDIKIEDIKVNHNKIGDLIINAENSDVQNVYSIDAKISDSKLLGRDKLLIKGIIDNNTKSPTLDLKADLKSFDLAFVQAFVKDIFTNFRGTATGEVAIGGTLKDVNYGGDIEVKDFGLRLNFSGVDYIFDDTIVTLSNGNMIFNLVGVKDSRANSKGMISIGRISLADLSNIGADLLIRSDDLMLLNTTQSDFDIFWGKVYAKGDLFVGYEKNTLKIDAISEILPNSVFTLNSNSASSVDEFKMLRFLELKDNGNITLAEKQKSGLALNVNLDITADKNSTVNVLVGDEVGDISVRGETKNMKFNMDKTGNMRLFGNYLVESGTYVSKAILEKIFQIQKGSNIQWSGDVMNPDLDITATYGAVISNASEYLGVGTLPTINVQLQTKITNKLTSPSINPSILALDVSSQIREVMAVKLSTEEERVLQFASILALGNFNVSNTNASSAIGSGMNVFFKQLSSAFNSISEDFQIDLDYIKGSEHSNTGDRATTSLKYNISPRLRIKTGVGVPLSNKANTKNNYLSGEGIIEYDWSKTIDGSKIFRVYSKPSNVGLVTGTSAGANQSYGGGVVISYGFNRIFPKRTDKDKEKQVPKKDSISQDTLKIR